VDSSLVQFLLWCINHGNEFIAVAAFDIFAENDLIPFDSEIVLRLYSRLSSGNEYDLNEIAEECGSALSAICSRYPDDTLQILYPVLQQCSDEMSIDGMRRMLRCVTSLHKYLECDGLIPSIVRLLESPVGNEAAQCLTTLCHQKSEMVHSVGQLLIGRILDTNSEVRMQAMRCLVDLFRHGSVPAQPYLSVILEALSKLECDEQMLVYDVADAFCESVTSLEYEDIDEFVNQVVATFVNAGPMDCLIVHSLRVICSILPLVGSRARSIAEEIGQKLLQGLSQVSDGELLRYCFEFLSRLLTVDPTSPIFSMSIEYVPLHITTVDRPVMIAVWAYVSDVLRCRADLGNGLIDPVIQAALSFDGMIEVDCLSNVALVLFDVLGVCRIGRDDAERLIEVLMWGLRRIGEITEENIIDVQNIGCCLVRTLASNPKLDFDGSCIEKLMPYLEVIENGAVREEVARLLSGLTDIEK
jgi:hypothetical protein